MVEVNSARRITDLLFNYWNEARGERLFPGRENIDDSALQEMGIWEDIFFVNVLPQANANKYSFSYTGKNLGKELGANSKEGAIQAMLIQVLEKAGDRYDMVAEYKRPVQNDAIFRAKETEGVVKYRQILLPLGPDDEGEVTAIIGGMRYIKA